MKTTGIKEALLLISEGFEKLAEAMGEDQEAVVVKQEVKVAAKKSLKNEEPKEEEEPKKTINKVAEKKVSKKEESSEEGAYSKEDLEEMSYNDLKVLAKNLGVKAVGSKDKLISSILGTTPSEEPKEENKEEKKKAPDKKKVEEKKTSKIKKKEEVKEEDVEPAEEENTLYKEVEEELSDYTDDELKGILDEIGISSKGKRQALLSKIVTAIEEGKLAWGDDEDEEDTGADEDEIEDDEDIEDDSDGEDEDDEDEDEDDEDDEDEDDPLQFDVGSEARIEAMESKKEELIEAYENEELTDKEISKFLKDYYNGKYKSKGEEEDFYEYARIMCNLIDDEGEEHEFEDPYYVGEECYCCGAPLKDVDGTLTCEVCGSQYE